jgi:hypothetical protein
MVANWRRVVAGAYEPKALYQRYATQAEKPTPTGANTSIRSGWRRRATCTVPAPCSPG